AALRRKSKPQTRSAQRGIGLATLGSPRDREQRQVRNPCCLSQESLIRQLRWRMVRWRMGVLLQATKRSYLITLSAWKSTESGIVSPIFLAVFKLITSSNFVGCSTGMSAGFAPLRILSIRVAARRNASSDLGPYDIRPPASAQSAL